MNLNPLARATWDTCNFVVVNYYGVELFHTIKGARLWAEVNNGTILFWLQGYGDPCWYIIEPF